MVESGGPFVAAVRVGDHDEAVVFGLHTLVLKTKLAAKLYAADLKPGEIISIIDHAHLVRFGVAHAHCCFSVVRHRRKIVTEWRTRRQLGLGHPTRATGGEEKADVCLTAQCSDVRLPRTSMDAVRRSSRRSS